MLQSCIVVKYQGKDNDEEVQKLELSPKPEIPMSDKLVKSPDGDMIAFLPEDWFFVDVEKEASSDIFAVAVNPDYTLSAVFSFISPDEISDKIIKKEGLLGLARYKFLNHQKKSSQSVQQIGSYSKIVIGANNFATFDMAAHNSGYNTKSAVFISSTGRYYQFSLIPMQIKIKPIPSDAEITTIFKSILTTINY